MTKRVLRKLTISEISGVTKPASPGCRAVIMKSDSTMTPEEGAATLAKWIDAGEMDRVSKADWHIAITKRGDEIRQPGDTDAMAYAKAVGDPVGKIMFRALKVAPDAPEPEPAKSEEPRHIGPAHAKLDALATDLVRSKPGMSHARAVANIYEENTALREQVRAEHLRHALARAG